MAESIKEFDDAADFLSKGGDMYSKINATEANKMFKASCMHYSKAGKISNAAKIHRQMAEAYENDLEYEKAIDCYEKATELFSLEKHHEQDVFKAN